MVRDIGRVPYRVAILIRVVTCDSRRRDVIRHGLRGLPGLIQARSIARSPGRPAPQPWIRLIELQT